MATGNLGSGNYGSMMGSLGMISGGYGRRKRSVDVGSQNTHDEADDNAVDDVVNEAKIGEIEEHLEQCISACADQYDKVRYFDE